MGEDAVQTLWREAATLAARARFATARGPVLPPLWFVTDPDRTPEPWRAAQRLPRGAGVIFRGFGRPEAPDAAARLAEVAGRRGLTLLIGADATLADAVGAAGVHLPERMLGEAAAIRADRPQAVLTGAAHSAEALDRAAEAGLDAAFVSPVFASRSPSAGAPLGVEAFTRLVREARLPVFALGGVTTATVAALRDTGAAGVAAVEGLALSSPE